VYPTIRAQCHHFGNFLTAHRNVNSVEVGITDIAKGIELAKEEEGEVGKSSRSVTREDYLLNG
jgi:hypothetical protein